MLITRDTERSTRPSSHFARSWATLNEQLNLQISGCGIGVSIGERVVINGIVVENDFRGVKEASSNGTLVTVGCVEQAGCQYSGPP